MSTTPGNGGSAAVAESRPTTKPTSMVNWFSSLRRQPKPKKTAISKALQKSCVDLSTAAAGPVVAVSAAGSTANLTAAAAQPHQNDSVLAQTSHVWTVSGAPAAAAQPATTMISRTETVQVDRQKRVSPANVATMTTKVIQTTVITKQSHRVGLVFNDDGELISKVDAFRNFANSLNNQLSGNALMLGGAGGRLVASLPNGGGVRMSNNNSSDSDSCRSSSLGGSSSQLNGDNDGEIEFIDCDRSPSEATTAATSPGNGSAPVKCEVGGKQIKDELCEVVAEMEALDSQEDCKHSNKNKQMSIGRKKFNMDPKKGIEYLCENHLLQMDAQDIAHFLYKGEGLNKTAIGDYLGEKNDFNEQVLKAFVELHDFTNLILVQALRQFLWSFRLPGEAQKIDRMMECFAQRYCQLNPDIFTNTDTCYVLSFAIIMLNTSLHNPSVKDKPTLEQFISMNRGINNGGDLPRELLESLYESIRTEPFKIPQDDGNDLMHTFFNPDKEGWLWKQGGRYKSWKRRWFILNDNCLYYFEYTTDKEPRGIIPLENISVREIQDRNKPHCFELYACGGADIIKACKTDSEGKVVEGKHTVYRMSAATEEDKLEWIKCLTQSISHNPFYDILVQRKKKALAKS